jgi:fructose-1,6-bisphosphatase
VPNIHKVLSSKRSTTKRRKRKRQRDRGGGEKEMAMRTTWNMWAGKMSTLLGQAWTTVWKQEHKEHT